MAAWTRRVLPSVRRWLERPSGAPVTFRLTQALTGHGAYNGYLCRFGIIPSPNCAHCSALMDDAEHTLFYCPFWDPLREDISVALGWPPQPQDVEGLLCGGELPDQVALGLRRVFLRMIEDLMAAKEATERDRQGMASEEAVAAVQDRTT